MVLIWKYQGIINQKSALVILPQIGYNITRYASFAVALPVNILVQQCTLTASQPPRDGENVANGFGQLLPITG
jgi:hypothetical protein